MGNLIDEICIHNHIYDYNKKTKVLCKVYKCFNRLLDGYQQDEIYVLHPDSSDGICFLNILSQENRNKVSDKNVPLGNSLIRWNAVNSSIKIIVETSKVQDAIIRGKVLQLINRCKVVNIYELLKKEGLFFAGEWYRELGLTYRDIYIDYIYYQKSEGVKKNVFIKKLICDFLAIKDFVNAEKAIKYLVNQYGQQDMEAVKYQLVWEKIQKYLDELKNKIDNKKHIVVNWIDALRYDELTNMSFLEREVQNGISFEKMYTAAPYTSATLKTIFTGKHLIDDKLYEMEDGKEYSKSKLFYYLRRHKYKFLCESARFNKKGKIFYDRSLEALNCFYIKGIYIPSTLLQFASVYRLSEENTKCFMLIHNLCETHAPWLNPFNGKRMPDKLEVIDYCNECEAQDLMGQIIMSQKYLDSQLEYYNQFYRNIKYNIYMSDHGQGRREKSFALEGLSHVVFAINGRSIQKRLRVKTITSLTAFPEIIEKCLEEQIYDLDEINENEYVMVQMDDVYSKNVATILKKLPKNKTLLQSLQYRAVITDDDSYIRFAIGVEYYFRNGTCENLINREEKFKDRIDYLKKAAGNRYINIYTGEKYQAAQMLYRELGLKIIKDIDFI